METQEEGRGKKNQIKTKQNKTKPIKGKLKPNQSGKPKKLTKKWELKIKIKIETANVKKEEYAALTLLEMAVAIFLVIH